MEDLEAIAEEYWKVTKNRGLGEVVLFVLSLIGIVVLTWMFSLEERHLWLFFFLEALIILMSLAGIHVGNIHFINALPSTIVKFNFLKSPRIVAEEMVLRKRMLLDKILGDKNILASDVLQVALVVNDIHKAFPRRQPEDHWLLWKRFLFHDDSKSRVMALIISSSAIVTSLVIAASEKTELANRIGEVSNDIMANYGLYIAYLILVVLGIFVVQYLYAFVRFLLSGLIKTKDNKVNHLLHEILKREKVEYLKYKI